MHARFVDTIERLTHREVKAFMSANHQAPDVTVEVFVLEREEIAPPLLSNGATVEVLVNPVDH